MKENKLLPISIILTSFNRVNFLKKTIEMINERTRYPFRIFVIDNNSTDGSVQYLKEAKVYGKIFEHLFLPENVGQSMALNEGFKLIEHWEARRPSDDLFCTTNEDILPPAHTPCWLERMKHLFEKYEPDGYSGLAMRIERTSRIEIDEEKELLELHKSFPSVFRMLRRSDIRKLGDRPFGFLKHWDSHPMADKFQTVLKKKYAMTTNLYASHIGYGSEQIANKGYAEGFTDYFTYAPNKTRIHIEKPYADIDPKTLIPLKINTNADFHEHKKREDYWNIETGIQSPEETRRKRARKDELAGHMSIATGRILDLGCGMDKISPDYIGVDAYPYDCVDIIHDVSDLWFYKDGEIDGIAASHVLEHMSDTKRVLKEWDRVLKSGGTMGIIVPDGDHNNGKTILEPSHKVAFTLPVIKCLIGGFLGHAIIHLDYVKSLSERKKAIICISQKK